MIDIAIVFGSYNLARTVAELTGLIETIGVKIDRLSRSDLQAALRALDQARRATSESDSLLREARSRLNKAISLEKHERSAAAYLALATTHHQLGDDENTKQILREFLDTDFSPPLAEQAEYSASKKQSLALVILFPLSYLTALALRGLASAANHRSRKERILAIKDAVRAYLGLDSGPPANI